MAIDIRVARMIFRADFPANFQIIDRPGTIMEILSYTIPDQFEDIGSGRSNPHSIRASRSDRNVHRQFVVEPNNINGTTEKLNGIALTKLRDDPEFKSASQLFKSVMDKVGVAALNRMGLRLFMFANFGERFGSGLARSKGLIGGGIFEDLNESIGEVTDLGIVLEGKKDDVYTYRAHTGPFVDSDIVKCTPNIGQTEAATPEAYGNPHYSFDIDIRQSNFSFKGMTLDSWAKHKLPLYEQIVTSVSNKLMEQ